MRAGTLLALLVALPSLISAAARPNPLQQQSSSPLQPGGAFPSPGAWDRVDARVDHACGSTALEGHDDCVKNEPLQAGLSHNSRRRRPPATAMCSGLCCGPRTAAAYGRRPAVAYPTSQCCMQCCRALLLAGARSQMRPPVRPPAQRARRRPPSTTAQQTPLPAARWMQR